MFELTLQRTFDVSVSQLYESWCKPELIQKWFAPGNMSVPEAVADIKEGGKYRIVMFDAEAGSEHIVGGKYETIIENQALDFTWQWEGSSNVTRVSVKFKALTETTSELVLNHVEFTDKETKDKHEMGWVGCLSNLPKAL